MSQLKSYINGMTKEERKIYAKIWRINNPEKNKETQIKFKVKNPNYSKDHISKNINRYRELRIKFKTKNPYYQKEYDLKNRDKANERQNNRYNSDILFKLKRKISNSINRTLKSKSSNKNGKQSIDILGCSIEEFKQHLQSKFEPWMNWNNMGGKIITEPNVTWDIDHIIPISLATTEKEILKLNHYTNFQPLCSYINRYIKRDRLDWSE